MKEDDSTINNGIRDELTKVLDKVGDSIDEITRPSDGHAHDFWCWHNGYLDNKELMTRLLPLTKLLNTAFFMYDPFALDVDKQ